MYIYIYIYIYMPKTISIYLSLSLSLSIYIYIYIYTYVHIISPSPRVLQAREAVPRQPNERYAINMNQTNSKCNAINIPTNYKYNKHNYMLVKETTNNTTYK